MVVAFSEDHIAWLTGLSRGQLRAWDKRGFFKPHHAYEVRRSPYSRVYSFKDAVGLRTISVLMKEHRVPLRELEKVAHELQRLGYRHWADTKLYVVNRQVHFRRPGSEEVEGLRDGQLAMLPIIDVMNDIEERVAQLRKRSPSQAGQIVRDRHVVRNAPVLAGTRIPTGAIRRFHEAGYSTAEILKEYPALTERDVEAALDYEKGLARRA